MRIVLSRLSLALIVAVWVSGRQQAAAARGLGAAGQTDRVDRRVIAFAGDADQTNPTQGGGAPYWSYPVHAALQRWAQLNECTAPSPTIWVARDVYEERYAGCAADAQVVSRMTVGGGHFWLADEEAMWAFFAGHARPQ